VRGGHAEDSRETPGVKPEDGGDDLTSKNYSRDIPPAGLATEWQMPTKVFAALPNRHFRYTRHGRLEFSRARLHFAAGCQKIEAQIATRGRVLVWRAATRAACVLIQGE
jgi:hypothetical protein